jgi:carboxyl-terminal processing protease
MKKKYFNYLKIVVCLIAVVIGGNFLLHKTMAATKSRFEQLELFNKVLFLIESQYYRTVDTQKLINGALRGMMNTLDPHSTFLDKKVFEKMQEDTKGEFAGLGIEVTQKDGVLLIITPIEDSPAYKAGLKAGDQIVEINHESTLGMTLQEAIDLMKGESDTDISIAIRRDNLEGAKNFTIKRKVIKIKPVKSELLDNEYLFVRLSQFQSGSSDYISKEIMNHEKKGSKQSGLKGIILDLRYNPGGLLDEAVDVSSLFLRDGVVVSTEGRDPKQKEIRYVKKTGYKALEIPMIVLVNGASASASEIVAGALQDHKRAIIMGTQTFGKGSVQTVAKVDEENGVKLTIAQYMTPTGKKIQALGIKPDVVVESLSLKEGEEQVQSDESFVREIDLRNHLTATIETEEEKKIRLENEKEDRLMRKNKYSKDKKNAKNQDTKIPGYQAKDDNQVQQALVLLKSFKKMKDMAL